MGQAEAGIGQAQAFLSPVFMKQTDSCTFRRDQREKFSSSTSDK